MNPLDLRNQLHEHQKKAERLFRINNTYFVGLTLFAIFLSILLTILASNDAPGTYWGISTKVYALVIGAVAVAVQTIVATFRFRYKALQYARSGVKFRSTLLGLVPGRFDSRQKTS